SRAVAPRGCGGGRVGGGGCALGHWSAFRFKRRVSAGGLVSLPCETRLLGWVLLLLELLLGGVQHLLQLIAGHGYGDGGVLSLLLDGVLDRLGVPDLDELLQILFVLAVLGGHEAVDVRLCLL